ncbi:hypothetical protein [Streptomyces sp. NPDC001985]|uniref:hypothetical protein n=1 Tax=Streptomyces sp. NPDC001985 TaxID=3154406 RepID=UPI00332ED228
MSLPPPPPLPSGERLAPGVALLSVPGRGLAVRTPEGEFLRVDTGGVSEAALLAALDGAPAGRDPGAARLTAAFAAAGYLAGDGAPDRGGLSGHRVHLVGDPVLTEPLARQVRSEGGEIRHLGPDSPLPGPPGPPPGDGRTAVVWCLDGPVPPGLWDEADLLPSRGIAWLRCHREGALVHVEPLAAAPGDVTSAHLRLRRLAATPAHRELAAYWAGPRAESPAPAHTPASAALTAGLLTADLLAWAASPHTPHRHLRLLTLPRLALTTHPVLPVPPTDPALGNLPAPVVSAGPACVDRPVPGAPGVSPAPAPVVSAGPACVDRPVPGAPGVSPAPAPAHP